MTAQFIALPADGSLVVVPKEATKEMKIGMLEQLGHLDPKLGYSSFNERKLKRAYHSALAARPPVDGVEVTEEMLQRVMCCGHNSPCIGDETYTHCIKDEKAYEAREVLAFLSSKQKERG